MLALPAAAFCKAAESPDGYPAISLCDNFSVDILGVTDNRQNTWGKADDYTHAVQILHVPPGHRVRVERVVGDFIMWPTMCGGAVNIPSGTYMGGLAAIHRYPRDGADVVGMTHGKGAMDHFVYVQTGTDGPVARASFDVDLRDVANNLLGETHEIGFKQAVWLNDTGVAAHMELTVSNLIVRMVRV